MRQRYKQKDNKEFNNLIYWTTLNSSGEKKDKYEFSKMTL